VCRGICCAVLCCTQTDMEYLKNLILQLYTTGEAEALLPVFKRLLSLGPEDVKRCKQVRCWEHCSKMLVGAWHPAALVVRYAAVLVQHG